MVSFIPQWAASGNYIDLSPVFSCKPFHFRKSLLAFWGIIFFGHISYCLGTRPENEMFRVNYFCLNDEARDTGRRSKGRKDVTLVQAGIVKV